MRWKISFDWDRRWVNSHSVKADVQGFPEKRLLVMVKLCFFLMGVDPFSHGNSLFPVLHKREIDFHN